MTRCLISCFVCALIVVTGSGLTTVAEELRFKAKELFDHSNVQKLQLSADGKAVELTRGLLIENDGDAAGFSYQPNEEALREGVRAIKRFSVKLLTEPTVAADGRTFQTLLHPPHARLLVGHTGKTLQLTIRNSIYSKEIPLTAPDKAGNYWKSYAIPPKVISPGENDFELSGEGKLWIARRDERGAVNGPKARTPRQSSKADDQAKQRFPSKLGPNNDIDGEYYVRLHLDGYQQDGTLDTPLFDAANLTGSRIPPAGLRVKRIQISAEGDWPAKKPWIGVYSPADAAGPQKFLTELSDTGEFNLADSQNRSLPRFFGVQVELPATHPDKTPRLSGITVRTEFEAAEGWGTRLTKLAEHNAEVNNYRPWFEHQSLEHARLAQLRTQYKLDEVVKGCTTDLQRMEKLAVWSSQQWTKGHLKDIYPKWDALEILKLHEDGTPVGGFCQQYNIVFLQACQSFGMVGRCVSIGAGDHGVNIRSGHEVVEIWSNELNKWVYVDGQAAWYFVDQETRTPLNLLELRERQIAALREQPHRAVEVVVLAKSPYEWKGLQQWPAFCELRMIPHTQFFDGKLPLPLNQGMRGWFWTGHRVWTDDVMPASILYDKRITNPRDWNFTVNQTQFWLTQQEKEGELNVRLAHNMTSFDHYVIKIGDGKEQIEKDMNMTWPLQKGENRIQVQAVNKLGVRGPASWAKVKWE